MDLTFLTLEEIKLQCRINAEDTDEEGILQIYGVSAEHTICQLINWGGIAGAIDHFGEELDGAPPLKQAMLMLTAHWYKFREATTPEATNSVPFGIMTLINPYVKLTSRDMDSSDSDSDE